MNFSGTIRQPRPRPGSSSPSARARRRAISIRPRWLAAEQASGAGPLPPASEPALPGLTHHKAKAKQVIYLHMVGGPPQMDLYDYKPKMVEMYDKDLPDSIRKGQRLTTMTSGQARFPIAPSKYKFSQHGKCGMWLSELLPYKAKMVD